MHDIDFHHILCMVHNLSFILFMHARPFFTHYTKHPTHCIMVLLSMASSNKTIYIWIFALALINFIRFHSHTNLGSRLERQIANACNIYIFKRLPMFAYYWILTLLSTYLLKIYHLVIHFFDNQLMTLFHDTEFM
jgi:hypothetical protein